MTVAGTVGASAVPAAAWVVLAGVMGLLVGSFANVVIYRVPLGLSVNHPRSFCPRCRTPIRAVDNVPVVSWLALRGRCRSCGAPIAARYPLVEAATGAGFALVTALVQPRWFAPGLCLLLATMVMVVVIDHDGLPLPARLAAIGTALGGAALLLAALADHRPGAAVRLAGGVAAAGLAGLALSAPARTRRGLRRLAGASPALLPAGAWLGCLALPATGVGVGVGVVLFGARWWWLARRSDRTVADGASGLAAAALAAAVAALVTAAAWGLGVPA